MRRELSDGEQLTAYPLEPAGGGYSFGGNYVYAWEFRKLCKYPIPVHDHLEQSPSTPKESRA